MRFEWDERKAKANFTKHGVLFETATLVFEDPYGVTHLDPVHSEEEQRYITLGLVDRSSVLLVVHTYTAESEEEAVRIISARLATLRERRQYEKADGRAAGKSRRH
jgi:hypothetical protein